MPNSPTKFSQFWQELKRRNVIRVITVYAASAFVSLELVDIISEPFGLPDWTLKLVVVILVVGLIVAIILSWIYDIHPEGGVVKTEPAEKAKAEVIPKPSNIWKIASYISFVVIIGLIALNIIRGNGDTRIDESLEKSIAVLPFQNFSLDPDQESMCLGLTDEIINHLYRIESFDKVVSLTSVLKYRTPDKNISEIATELGVNYILEGVYKKIDEKISVSAQLIEPSSDKHIWQQDYNRDYKDIMSIQSDIALQIAGHLKAYIADFEQRNIKKVRTVDQEAYENYVRGRFYWFKRDEVSFLKGLEYFQKSIELSPDYPLAYLGLADTYSMLANYGSMPPHKAFPRALNAVNRALRIDPDLAEVHNSMAIIEAIYHYNWDGAISEFEKALSLSSNNSVSHQWYAWILSALGKFDEAVYHIHTAQELDPVSELMPVTAGVISIFQKDIPAAIRKLSQAIEMDSTYMRAYYFLCQAFIVDKQYEAAVAASTTALELSRRHPQYLSNHIYILGESGNLDEARKCYNELEELSFSKYVSPFDFAVGSIGIGAYDEALSYLQDAYDNRDTWVIFSNVDPVFDKIRDLKGFMELLRKLDLQGTQFPPDPE